MRATTKEAMKVAPNTLRLRVTTVPPGDSPLNPSSRGGARRQSHIGGMRRCVPPLLLLALAAGPAAAQTDPLPPLSAPSPAYEADMSRLAMDRILAGPRSVSFPPVAPVQPVAPAPIPPLTPQPEPPLYSSGAAPRVRALEGRVAELERRLKAICAAERSRGEAPRACD